MLAGIRFGSVTVTKAYLGSVQIFGGAPIGEPWSDGEYWSDGTGWLAVPAAIGELWSDGLPWSDGTGWLVPPLGDIIAGGYAGASFGGHVTARGAVSAGAAAAAAISAATTSQPAANIRIDAIELVLAYTEEA